MKFYNSKIPNSLFQEIKKRKKRQSMSLYPLVSEIIDEVIENGDEAIRRYTKIYDDSSILDIRVSKEEMKMAYDWADPLYIDALELAIENITIFHQPQLLKGYEIVTDHKTMGQKVRPLKRVGIYVPGGEAAYPSTLLMNVIPAKIAGVEEIVVVTPPQKDHEKLDNLLVAAYMLEVEELYLVGGVQAIAALAYGTQTISPVDKITGPGNQYVTAAKKLVYGDVAIDMIAGPSEVMIISDGTASLKLIVADMLAQLEHDKEAMAILLTISQQEIDDIEDELQKQVKELERTENIKRALEQNTFIVKCESLVEMNKIANEIAPEHLELLIDQPIKCLDQITDAGAIFLGKYTPEALGDYIAGPNHTLPTTGSAHFQSPLGTYDFQKRINYLYCDKTQLEQMSVYTDIFTKKERLEAHGKAVRVRL